jgi:subtilisin-like proprotein convertase family protein
MKRSIYLLALLLLMLAGYSVSAQSWWSEATESDATRVGGDRQITPEQYRLVSLDLDEVKAQLDAAPRWFTPQAETDAVELTFPMPDGTVRTFQVVEAPVMSDGLAARYPEMRSFAGKSREDGTAYARFGYTHKGFHAMILSGQHSTVFIDVFATGQTRFHQVYYKKDYRGMVGNDFVCHVSDDMVEDITEATTDAAGLVLGDCILRDYRLALACTGEYAQFHGGTIPDVLAEFNVAMTRVNGVYETDFTVHMELIDRTDELIFLDGNTDPYTNNSGGTMLGQNQATIDDIIGFNNYDVGHVFSTGGGGIASLNAPCNSNKARGVTGLTSPINDPFYIDYVAHELGHQYGANHTQNNDCNRVNATAMEPGSASTIMGYAGICSPNVQNNSDDHFHAISIQEVTNFIEFGSGGSCPTTTDTGNSGPEVTTEASAYTLPISTPFFLTAIATDADDDMLTYCWEQMDNQIAQMPPQSTNTGGPAFRSNSPIPSPTRYFPNLPAVVNNTTPTWEVIPSVAREMNFRCTVRDNAMGAGCTSFTDVDLTFTADAGPFEVLAPNTAVTWIVGESETVTWDVANTDAAPVSCSEVDILLSTDGGLTYTVTLAENVPNNGSATIAVPFELTEEARVQVVCSDNIFYDISNEDFAIELPPTPSFLLDATPDNIRLCSDTDAMFEIATTLVTGFDEPLTFSVTGLPDGATATFDPNPANGGEMVSLVVSNFDDALPGAYTLEIEATSATVTKVLTVSIELDTGVPSDVTLATPASGSQMIALDSTLVWNSTFFADDYLVEIATSPEFGNTIVETATVSSAFYQPSQLEELTVYYWRVTPSNLCGSAVPSEVFSFQTLKNNCLLFVNDTPDLTIPPSGTGVYSSILNIPDDLQIVDINFYLDMNHTWVGDLSAVLTSPNGTQVQLFDQPGVPGSQFGCGEDNLLVSFDDEAENTAEDFENSCDEGGAYTIEGNFQPIDALSSFAGESAFGDWTLEIGDVFDEDGGTVISWAIEICVEPVTINAAEQIVNLPLEVFNDRSDTITTALLAYEKAGLMANELTYRITENTTNGFLIRLPGEDTLNVGASFTQEDIDLNTLIYKHDGSMTTTDLFLFDLLDPEGGWVADQAFNILIVEPAALSASAEITGAILCDGGAEGSVELFVAGGIPPYQYSMDGMSFQSSPVFDNLSEGTYTFTVRDDEGVELEVEPVTITAPAPVAATATALNSAITIDAMGGTAPYTYSLDGTVYQEANTFSDLDNGMYTIQILDANNCAGSLTVEVNSILTAEISTTAASCAENMDGGIEVGAISGGTMPYTYQINDGASQSSPVFADLLGGTYSLLITGANGNTLLVQEIEVPAPTPLELLITTPSNGLLLDANGGTPPYEYSIDGGATFTTTQEYADLANGTYEVAVQDANGCTFTSMATVSFIGMASIEITSVSCAGNEDGSISIISIDGGIAPYTYSLNEGAPQADGFYGDLPAGSYDLFIEDSEGNTLLMEGLTVPEPAPLEVMVQSTGSSLIISVEGGTMPYQYSIDGGMTFFNTAEFTDLDNADYDIAVIDANGCPIETTGTVNNIISANIEVNDLSCAGSNDGSIQITTVEGGTMPYMYSLNGEDAQAGSLFENLASGTYDLTVMDVNGNTFLLENIEVETPEELILNTQLTGNDLLLEGNGGTMPYEYSIDGGMTFTTADEYNDLPNGTYDIVIQDANGCTTSSSITINLLVSAEATTEALSCAGSGDGAIIITNIVGGVAPYEFSLNGGPVQSEPTFVGLSAGTYEVQIIDADGSSILIEDITVEEPLPLALDVEIVGNTITLEGQGGTPSYEYSIDGGATFSTETSYLDLPNGNYDLIVQDANGCTFTTVVTINIIVDVQAETTNITCFGADDGSIEVTEIVGGTAPYTFQLEDGEEQSEGLFENLASGVYTLTVTDANGNVFTIDGLLIVTPTPVIFTSTVMTDSISIMASNGTPPYQYSIDGGVTFSENPVFTGLENGDYEVVVQDANDCLSEIETVTVVVNSTSNIPFGWTIELVPNPTSGYVLLTGTGLPGNEINWQLVSPLGQSLRSGMAPTIAGDCQIQLSLTDLPAGTYWIWLRSENGQSGVLPVVRQ